MQHLHHTESFIMNTETFNYSTIACVAGANLNREKLLERINLDTDTPWTVEWLFQCVACKEMKQVREEGVDVAVCPGCHEGYCISCFRDIHFEARIMLLHAQKFKHMKLMGCRGCQCVLLIDTFRNEVTLSYQSDPRTHTEYNKRQSLRHRGFPYLP